MGETIVSKAFTLSDSIFLVLLIALAIGTWWLIRYVLRVNEEREKRYIDVIDKQAEGLKLVEEMRSDVKEIKQAVFKG